MATVYLLHFERPYKHAKHYVGYTALESLEERLQRHARGAGARLLAVLVEHGIGWSVARRWDFDRTLDAKAKEKRLKYCGASRVCPICKRGGTVPAKVFSNKAMERKLKARKAIDIGALRMMPEEGDEPGLVRLSAFIDDVDYCDAEAEAWVWSIGRRHSDGAVFAAFDTRLYQNPTYECLWLR